MRETDGEAEKKKIRGAVVIVRIPPSVGLRCRSGRGHPSLGCLALVKRKTASTSDAHVLMSHSYVTQIFLSDAIEIFFMSNFTILNLDLNY